MPTNNEYTSPQDFLKKMDAGDFDGDLLNEIKKLSHEHLEEVVKILMDRDVSSRPTSSATQI